MLAFQGRLALCWGEFTLLCRPVRGFRIKLDQATRGDHSIDVPYQVHRDTHACNDHLTGKGERAQTVGQPLLLVAEGRTVLASRNPYLPFRADRLYLLRLAERTPRGA